MSRSKTRSGAVYGDDPHEQAITNAVEAYEIDTDPLPLEVSVAESKHKSTGASLLEVKVTCPVDDLKTNVCHINVATRRVGHVHDQQLMTYLTQKIEDFRFNNTVEPIESVAVRVHVVEIKTGKFRSFHKFEWTR